MDLLHTGSAAGASEPAPSGQLRFSLIDNLDDGDARIIATEARTGQWYRFGDATGTVEFMAAPIPTPRDDGGFAARMLGAKFTNWGAGLGFYLTETTPYYDAGAFAGIRFFAKCLPGSSRQLRLNLPNRDTTSFGGVCDASAVVKECDDHFGFDVELGNEWSEYLVFFGDLRQVGWGRPVGSGFNSTVAHDVQFLAREVGADFDIWIDDVSLILR